MTVLSWAREATKRNCFLVLTSYGPKLRKTLRKGDIRIGVVVKEKK